MLSMLAAYLIEYNIDFSYSDNRIQFHEIDTGFYGVQRNEVVYNYYNDGKYRIEYYNKGYYSVEHFSDIKDLMVFICKLEGVYFDS